ncbi:glycoside hydrolase family 35 protein [Actinomadura rupiterrae]|uniref:glycoside hydrolase family 35 protein n=1 Tax=Actinomadura rupiterrae TaxID=559627 RepID=UPI0020A3F342|nr:beta-galactosidase family protein [Actinomadura rupiterrae]MCP2339341.1 beta-galactosidase [Actinomadura rupiterrae]
MLLSGALHYFRVLPEQWPQRLAMLRAMGLDTVETYLAWNLHEPEPGRFDFEGRADIGRFLDLAAEAGLDAIVRPGPYICAEWDNGGLPSWLLADRSARLRCHDPVYLGHVARFFDAVLPPVVERQRTRGGNVVMVQVENEYGSFGTDRRYLEWVRDALLERGVDVPLVTSDGPTDHMLTGGSVPGAAATANFGSDPETAFATLARYRPDDPPMCMEFWNGWFDHWGDRHVTRDASDAADVLERILAAGASVNLYMAHGGTNFGTSAGANLGGDESTGAYQPTVTSYDYDAPIDERGAPTAKFHAFREVLAKYQQREIPEPEPLPPLLPAGTVRLDETLRLLDVPPASVAESAEPPTFEELGLHHGLVRYTAEIPGPRKPYDLHLDGLADRAHVYVDGTLAAVLERSGETSVPVEVAGESASLEILVESMGRVNYGPRIGDRKGLVGGVRHERQFLHGWTAATYPVDDISALPWGVPDTAGRGPVFHRGVLTVEEPRDGYLALPGWTKGYAWINGFCLGRYWDRGPQRTLYLPWPLLRPGDNELVVLELDGVAEPVAEIRTEPEL